MSTRHTIQNISDRTANYTDQELIRAIGIFLDRSAKNGCSLEDFEYTEIGIKNGKFLCDDPEILDCLLEICHDNKKRRGNK